MNKDSNYYKLEIQKIIKKVLTQDKTQEDFLDSSKMSRAIRREINDSNILTSSEKESLSNSIYQMNNMIKRFNHSIKEELDEVTIDNLEILVERYHAGDFKDFESLIPDEDKKTYEDKMAEMEKTVKNYRNKTNEQQEKPDYASRLQTAWDKVLKQDITQENFMQSREEMRTLRKEIRDSQVLTPEEKELYSNEAYGILNFASACNNALRTDLNDTIVENLGYFVQGYKDGTINVSEENKMAIEDKLQTIEEIIDNYHKNKENNIEEQQIVPEEKEVIKEPETKPVENNNYKEKIDRNLKNSWRQILHENSTEGDFSLTKRALREILLEAQQSKSLSVEEMQLLNSRVLALSEISSAYATLSKGNLDDADISKLVEYNQLLNAGDFRYAIEMLSEEDIRAFYDKNIEVENKIDGYHKMEDIPVKEETKEQPAPEVKEEKQEQVEPEKDIRESIISNIKKGWSIILTNNERLVPYSAMMDGLKSIYNTIQENKETLTPAEIDEYTTSLTMIQTMTKVDNVIRSNPNADKNDIQVLTNRLSTYINQIESNVYIYPLNDYYMQKLESFKKYYMNTNDNAIDNRLMEDLSNIWYKFARSEEPDDFYTVERLTKRLYDDLNSYQISRSQAYQLEEELQALVKMCQVGEKIVNGNVPLDVDWEIEARNLRVGMEVVNDSKFLERNQKNAVIDRSEYLYRKVKNYMEFNDFSSYGRRM